MMQNVMRVYYDEKGNIKNLKYLRTVATSHNVDLIEIYCDFDISRYQANISFTRADGMTLGPYPLLPKRKMWLKVDKISFRVVLF